jgi:hypothetical protein
VRGSPLPGIGGLLVGSRGCSTWNKRPALPGLHAAGEPQTRVLARTALEWCSARTRCPAPLRPSAPQVRPHGCSTWNIGERLLSGQPAGPGRGSAQLCPSSGGGREGVSSFLGAGWAAGQATWNHDENPPRSHRRAAEQRARPPAYPVPQPAGGASCSSRVAWAADQITWEFHVEQRAVCLSNAAPGWRPACLAQSPARRRHLPEGVPGSCAPVADGLARCADARGSTG